MKQLEPEILTRTHVRSALSPEDQARADWYALIARLFGAAPDAALLDGLAQADALAAEDAASALDAAWEQLVLAASLVEADSVDDEFSALFVSVGTPQINPYASYYLSGFMMEKPLASLRSDLAALGLARAEQAAEPEDHLAALCEVMRLLITGGAGLPRRSIREQRSFFMKHLAPWYGRCLNDVRNAKGANFYRRVCDVTQAFFEIEYQAFELDDEGYDELLMQHGMREGV